MKTFYTLGLGILLTCCTSCVSYTPPVERGGQLKKSGALLYGRFYYGTHFKEEASPSWYTTGLWINNETDHRPVYIQFADTNPVYAVQIVPGRYRIAGFVRSDNEHGVKNRNAFPATNLPAAFATPFEARPGDRIYIGDYIWETKLDYPMLYWKLKSITNNFAATTMEFRQAYPRLLVAPAKSIFNPNIHEP